MSLKHFVYRYSPNSLLLYNQLTYVTISLSQQPPGYRIQLSHTRDPGTTQNRLPPTRGGLGTTQSCLLRSRCFDTAPRRLYSTYPTRDPGTTQSRHHLVLLAALESELGSFYTTSVLQGHRVIRSGILPGKRLSHSQLSVTERPVRIHRSNFPTIQITHTQLSEFEIPGR